MLPVSFYTLGCKLNQNETEALSDAFGKEGFTVLPLDFSDSKKQVLPENFLSDAGNSEPLLCIINTCTVTSKAEQKARRIIRLCLRCGFTVVVTGCYAQLEKEDLEKLGKEKKSTGTLFVFPGQGKEKLLDLPRYLADTLKISDYTDPSNIKEQLSVAIKKFFCNASLREEKSEIISRNPFSFNPQHFSFHSRSFLKIQDGCDFSCSYCRVPLARGKSISLGSEEALARLQALEKAGMAETVLTGVNICQYRDTGNPPHTLSKPHGLPELLRYLLDNTERIAIRLSSIEPDTHPYTHSDTQTGTKVVENFYDVLADRRIRNHFHLSVQSGSDSILAAMGRPYKAEDILRMTERLRAIRDDPFIACDIITGFPGETEGDFEKTADLCRKADFAWIHVFPYSKRPGTKAAAIKEGLVSERVAGERLKVLMEYAKKGKHAYIRRWQGKTVEATAESTGSAPAQTGIKSDFFPFFPALTDNYIKVRISLSSSCRRIAPGNACLCKIGQVASAAENGFDAWAELVE